jgi:hypothetical protein
MSGSHVVSALVDKRAEIAGRIRQMEQQLGQFRADLMHCDAMIRLFAPELEPRTIRAKAIRQSDGWFGLGEVRRLVLDVLRGAIRPLRAPELVVAVMAAKGFDPADRASFIKVQWKVGATLRGLAKRRLLVAATRTQDGAVVWQIADHEV